MKLLTLALISSAATAELRFQPLPAPARRALLSGGDLTGLWGQFEYDMGGFCFEKIPAPDGGRRLAKASGKRPADGTSAKVKFAPCDHTNPSQMWKFDAGDGDDDGGVRRLEDGSADGAAFAPAVLKGGRRLEDAPPALQAVKNKGNDGSGNAGSGNAGSGNDKGYDGGYGGDDNLGYVGGNGDDDDDSDDDDSHDGYGGALQSMTGGCLAVRGTVKEGKNLKVVECDQHSPKQHWSFDGDGLSLSHFSDLCVGSTPINNKDPVLLLECGDTDSIDYGDAGVTGKYGAAFWR